MTVGPAVLKHFVDPQFHQRRQAVPLDGMLKNHQIRAFNRFLFSGDVDIKIGIEVVKRAHFNIGQITDGRQQPLLFLHPSPFLTCGIGP